MAAVGFGLVLVGGMLVYAGMTGESLVGAVQQVVTGKKPAAKAPATRPATPSSSGASGAGKPAPVGSGGSGGGGGSW